MIDKSDKGIRKMCMKPLVSIIIPVYNAQKYIYRCLESVRNQTYQNFECILVNDGSIDQSEKIICEFIVDDRRFKYIYQKNQGPSVARNRGIKVAEGKYLVFVDSDDYILEDYLYQLIAKIDLGYDLVCCGYTDISENGEILWNDFICESFSKDSLISCIIHGTGGVLWGKIFKTTIVRENKIYLDRKLFMCEDLIFVLEYVKYVNEWACINNNLYIYNRLNKASISNNIDERYIENYEIFFERQYTLLQNLEIDKKRIEDLLKNRIEHTLVFIFENSKDYEAIRRNLHDKQILQKAFERLVDVNFELRLAIEKKDLLLKIYSYLKKRIHFWGHKIKLGVRRIKL